MKQRVASFLVPVLTAVILLYQVVTDLRIAVLQGATLWVIGLAMLAAAVAGLLAAFGPAVVRVGVLVACTLLFLDVSFHLSGAFDHLRPEGRTRVSRDEKRIADMHRIKAALDQYTARIGPLPSPMEYGEEAGVPSFWNQWWDISSRDGNQDGAPFLGFLTDAGILPSVPVDPVNRSPDGDPRHGQQYVYYLIWRKKRDALRPALPAPVATACGRTSRTSSSSISTTSCVARSTPRRRAAPLKPWLGRSGPRRPRRRGSPRPSVPGPRRTSAA
jgi:hypothetical protein